MVDGQLLRMDKQFRHLKQRQQETISYWLYEEYRHQWLEIGQEPLPRDTGRIVDAVMEKIKAAGIWIPEQEVRQYFSRKKSHFKNRIEKELDSPSGPSSTESTESRGSLCSFFTCEMEKLARGLGSESLFCSQTSEIAKSLNERVNAFHDRNLSQSSYPV